MAVNVNSGRGAAGADGVKPVTEAGPIIEFGANVPAAKDRDGICAAQTLGEAGDLELDGELVANDAYDAGHPGGRFITLYSGGNLSGVTFTVTGTDKDGAPQSEELAGPNNTTVQTTKFFASVTGVAAAAEVATAVEVGTGDSVLLLEAGRARAFVATPADNGGTMHIAIAGGPENGAREVALILTKPATLTVAYTAGEAYGCDFEFEGGSAPVTGSGDKDFLQFVCNGETGDNDQPLWLNTILKQELAQP